MNYSDSSRNEDDVEILPNQPIENPTRSDGGGLAENNDFSIRLGEDDFDGPPPLKENATATERREYKLEVQRYTEEIFNELVSLNVTGKNLWIEFTSTFRPRLFEFLTKGQQLKWVQLLLNRNVYVRRQQGYARSRALIDCLKSDKYIPNNDDEKLEEDNQVTVRGQVRSQSRNGLTERQAKEHNYKQIEKGTNENARAKDTSNITSSNGAFNLGVNGLMRAYSKRSAFSGGLTEDLHSSLEEFNTLCQLCMVTEEEKAQCLPIMLQGEALSFFSRTYTPGESFSSIVSKFKERYTSAEQKHRLLHIWQTTRLLQCMQESPEKSEAEVFHNLTTELGRIHRQLDDNYQNDVFLRDQIIVATNIPDIQRALREKVPCSSQEAIQRIATFLSNEPQSAGAHVALSDENKVYYTLGRKYGGDAKKNIRPWNKYPKKHTNKISSKWLAGIKGCWVCGGNHQARSKHSKSDVLDAIGRMQKSNPAALISIDDMNNIINDMDKHSDECVDKEEEEANIIFSDDSDSDYGYITEDVFETHKSHERYLANVAFCHGRTFATDLRNEISVMNAELLQGERDDFKGIYIDTCANRSSVMSIAQYRAYCREFNVPCRIDKTDIRSIKGIGGRSQPIGSVVIPVPFQDLVLVIDVKFRIVPDNVPSLLSNKDMIDNGLDISIQKKVITFNKREQPLILSNYFLIHKWKSDQLYYSMFTEEELRRLHRSFGHLSVNALLNLLRRAKPEKITKEVEESLKDLTKSCTVCATNSSKPKRFKLTIGCDDLRFNHIVAVDIMYLNHKPVLHIVDEATHYQSAGFLPTQKSKDVWKCLIQCWSLVYLGPPYFLHVDQGSNFISKEFLDSADAQGIQVLPVPIELPNSMSHVERYHAPLRAAFNKIRSDLPRSESDKECLQMALKSVNDTIGPEGLCPTLLVYGALPRLASRRPAETQLARAKSIDLAMDAVHKEQSKRRLSFGLRKLPGPHPVESSADLYNLPSGAPVYVYRTSTKRWEGPFRFISIDGETAVIQLPSGRKIFRSTVVKPVNGSSWKSMDEGININNETDDHSPSSSTTFFNEDTLRDPCGYNVESISNRVQMKPNSRHTFIDSRRKELDGLIGRGVFEKVSLTNVPSGARIYGTRWVDELKTMDGITKEKSRLIAQNYKDKEASGIATKAPTVSRLGRRLAIATAPIFPTHVSYVRDISQAYIQSESSLDRDVFLRPPSEMNLDTDTVLKALKPLYGIPESGLHWFLTYQKHHINNLNMVKTRADPCVLYKTKEKSCEGICVLQVDDSYGHGCDAFLQDEELNSKRFASKPRIILR